MPRLNNKGFAAVEGLLLLIIVGIVGLVGWYVWKQNQTNNQNNAPQSSAYQPADKSVNSFAACAKKGIAVSATFPPTCTYDGKTYVGPKNTGKFLEIKEYGIKIPLTENTEDAYYIAKEGYIYMSTHSVDKYPACRADENKVHHGLAAVTKAKLGDDNTALGTPLTEEDAKNYDATKIGDYYYWIDGNQFDCTEGKSADKYTEIRSDLAGAKVVKL